MGEIVVPEKASKPLKQRPESVVVEGRLTSRDRLLSKLLLLIGVLCLIGFVALYQMQLSRDAEIVQVVQELDRLKRLYIESASSGNTARRATDLSFEDDNTEWEKAVVRKRYQHDSLQLNQPEISSTVSLYSFFGKLFGSRNVDGVNSYDYVESNEAQHVAKLRKRRDTTVQGQTSPGEGFAASSTTSCSCDNNVTCTLMVSNSPQNFGCSNVSECDIWKNVENDVKKLRRSVKKSKQLNAIHLVAYINEDALARLPRSEGNDERIKGQFEQGAFNLKNTIFNIWMPDDWYEKRLFNYHERSGKVRVKEAGIYLIYAQVLFHDPSMRQAVAIHVGDEVKPFAEYLFMQKAFLRMKRASDGGKNRRNNGTHGADDSDFENLVPLYRNRRDRRHEKVYTRASIVAVTRINKNQMVFVKSVDTTKGIVIKRHLTYWGLARLNARE